ncbi:hypothetical protein [Rhodococcus sp. SGAir0479]|uniref:hypothetical protein n=1 Tax=Rhodococcus sp. SGAir0479 TaxID=2567884 RepID=UPI00158640B7|nr:hypothetical protein [Rhodococcus sp. SGAir0479]
MGLTDGMKAMEFAKRVPAWPQRLRWFPLAGAVVTGGMTLVMPVAVVRSLAGNELATIFAGVAMTLLAAFATVGLAGVAGVRHLRLSKRIVVCQDDVGAGIAIPSRHHLAPLLVALGATAVVGLVVAAGWFLGVDAGPLAAEDRGQAHLLTGGGIALSVLFVAFLGFHSVKEVRLYPGGVRRMVTLRRLWSTRTVETFVSWDDVVEFEADEQVVRGALEGRNPIIWLVSGPALPESSRLQFDKPDRMRLDAHLLVAEPNTLLTVLSVLRESAPLRRSLADPGATALLTPPPLRSRLWPQQSRPLAPERAEPQ